MPSASKERALFSPETRDRRDAETLLLTWREGSSDAVARVALIHKQGEERAMLGFFECVEDPAAAAGLFSEVTCIARERGARSLLGPIDYSTWNRYRLLSDGFEAEPFLLEPLNPEWYPARFLENGFAVKERYVSSISSDPDIHIAKAKPHVARFNRAGYSIRPFDMARWESEIAVLHDITMKAFAGALLFEPIGLTDLAKRYAPFKSFIDPGLCGFAVDPEGREIAFVFAYPDRFRLVEKLFGMGSLISYPRFLNDAHRGNRGLAAYERIVLKTLAVAPGFRKVLPAPVLASWLNERAKERGVRTVIHALMHVFNRSLEVSSWSAEPFREYSLYERIL